MPTTRGPQASDLDSGDIGGEEALPGSLGDLRRTATFAQETGVSILVFEKKKKKTYLAVCSQLLVGKR